MNILLKRKQKVRGELEIRPDHIQVIKATQVRGEQRKHRLEIVVRDESLRLSVVIPFPLVLASELADGIEWLKDPEGREKDTH